MSMPTILPTGQLHPVLFAVVEDTLHLSLMSVGSGNAFHSWHVETENGITSIYARDVLVSPLYSSGDTELEIPLKGVQEVWLGGRSGQLVWQNGVQSPHWLWS